MPVPLMPLCPTCARLQPSTPQNYIKIRILIINRICLVPIILFTQLRRRPFNFLHRHYNRTVLTIVEIKIKHYVSPK